MEIDNIKIDSELNIFDGDMSSLENHIHVSDNGLIYRNGELLKSSVKLPKYPFPIIRIISDQCFLLVDGAEMNSRKANAWVIDFTGKIKTKFYVGTASKIITTDDKIIVSYHSTSECIYGSSELAVFNFDGECLFKFQSKSKRSSQIQIFENYGFVNDGNDSVYFMPYLCGGALDYPIVKLDLKNFTHEVLFYLKSKEIESPKNFVPQALTKKGETWYFLSHEYDGLPIHKFRSEIYRLEKSKVSKIGECGLGVKIRGFPDGHFFGPLISQKRTNESCYISL